MGVYRRVIDVTRRAAVVGVNGPFSLSVNPISFLTLHVDGVVAGLTAVGQNVPWTDIDNINVTFNGASMVNINGEDLRALLVALGWRTPYVLNAGSATNGDIVRVSIPIPFSRKRFWLREGFPATRSGELQISLTFAAQGATFQSRNFSIESTMMLDGEPQRFLKYVTQSRALAVGDVDMSLPVGNPYVGLVIFEPALADAGVGTGTLGEVRLLVDEVEWGIGAARFESMRDMLEQKGHPITGFLPDDLPQLGQYGYIDFDPLGDDSYLLETVGRASVKLRPTLDNPGTVRAIPIELVAVRTGAAGGGQA